MELSQILAQNEVYKNMERKVFDQKDLVQDAASKESSISEMGKFRHEKFEVVSYSSTARYSVM